MQSKEIKNTARTARTTQTAQNQNIKVYNNTFQKNFLAGSDRYNITFLLKFLNFVFFPV